MKCIFNEFLPNQLSKSKKKIFNKNLKFFYFGLNINTRDFLLIINENNHLYFQTKFNENKLQHEYFKLWMLVSCLFVSISMAPKKVTNLKIENKTTIEPTNEAKIVKRSVGAKNINTSFYLFENDFELLPVENIVTTPKRQLQIQF